MTLPPGTRLGPYEIVSALGAGGMGEVYKARDTRLDRSVAIKILPHALSTDPDRRARFEREARTVAGLSHPHICSLHDVGEHEGSMFLVMEHLAGETLAQRLQKGPLPRESALIIASEIADALATAHRHGVIHRDLKPGNVMLTKAGAKLLDFGLAKLAGQGEQPAVQVASMATQSLPLTAEGAIVGTLQYMAPEQVEGKAVDARTDIWALGAILYEMLTGKRAFEGTSAATLIGNIMNAEPVPLATLHPLAPPVLDRLVRQCLAKSPDDRPDTAHDVAQGLLWMREASSANTPGPLPRRRLGAGWRAALGVLTALLLILTAAGVTSVLLRSVSPATVTRLSLDVRPAEALDGGGARPARLLTPAGSRTAFAWSVDGRAFVFVGRRAGKQQLYVRELDHDEARPLAGTEGAQVPAVSPDGTWVAFWADRKLKKVPLAGGPAGDVAPATLEDEPPMGLSWDGGGNLYFARPSDYSIWKISAGGAVALVTKPGERERAHVLPYVLPGDRALLYTVRRRDWSWGGEVVVAQSLTTGERHVVLTDAADARYVATGHLVFLRRGQLFAVAFDAERMQTRGTPTLLLDGVVQALTASGTSDVTGAGQFAIATTGTLAWVPGSVVPFEERVPATVDRQGRISRLAALNGEPVDARSYAGLVRLSPHRGGQLAVTIRTLDGVRLWTVDLARGTLNPVTRDGEVYAPIWTPTGDRLIFSWLRDGRHSLAWQRPYETGDPDVLMDLKPSPSSWTPDGRHLALTTDTGGGMTIATVENGKATVQPPAAGYREMWPEFSADGRWLAYGSEDSGRWEIYVRPYPGPDKRIPVSTNGGESPAWNPNGRELFFITPTNAAGKRSMMVVGFDARGPVGAPLRLFEFAERDLNTSCLPARCYDVAPDGQRFYMMLPKDPSPPPAVTHVNIVLNWFEELKAKVPVR